MKLLNFTLPALYILFSFFSISTLHAEPNSHQHATEIEVIRNIVRQELSNRERELDLREKQLEKREAELSSKLELPEPISDEKAIRAPGQLAIELGGYGDIQADFYDKAESIDQPEGSRGQAKSTFDTERFVIELEAIHEASDLEIEAEIEFEHGGTGSAQEIEFEEFGEFENEVEKGGEVQIEELYIQKSLPSGFTAKIGRFYTAIGTLSYYYLPTDYLAVRRPEVEEVMLPGQWDEIGISVEKEFSLGSATLQIVNGLDSTGFSAAGWISDGHQTRFEGVRAEDLALVSRVDFDSVLPGFLLGFSGYLGNSTGNRPRDDLDVDGTVIIGSANYRYWGSSLKAQGAFYLGSLSDAEEISERNSRLPNSLGVARTPVADGAIGLWNEVGFNISPLVGIRDNHQLSPFLRFDYYDTYFDTRASLADNGRFERTVYTLGLAYMYNDFLTAKLNLTKRNFGENAIESQDSIGLGFGFVY